MKKKTLLTIAILLGTSIALSAQNTQATVTATPASANLLVAMTLTQNSALSFGSNLMTNTSGGTVVLPSSSTNRIYTDGVSSSAATPSASNATYSVTGTAFETYAVVLGIGGAGDITVTHTSATTGEITMVISDMTARFSDKDADATISTLSSTGTDGFSLGGTLTVKANQVGGQYEGTFPVTVDYN